MVERDVFIRHLHGGSPADQPRVVPVDLVLHVLAGRVADELQLVVGPAAGCALLQGLLRLVG